jgi:hypothetical protein
MSLNDAISGLCLYWFRYFISAYHQLENVLITWWWSSREVSFLLVQNCGGEIYSFVVFSSDSGSLVYFCCAGCLEPSFIVLRYVSVFHLACAESWNIALLCDKCKNYFEIIVATYWMTLPSWSLCVVVVEVLPTTMATRNFWNLWYFGCHILVWHSHVCTVSFLHWSGLL